MGRVTTEVRALLQERQDRRSTRTGGTCTSPLGTRCFWTPSPCAGPPGGPAAAEDPAAPAVQELLKFWTRYGRPHVLVRWAGSASGDAWEPLERPTNCEAALRTSYQLRAASPRTAAARGRRAAAAASADRFHRRRGSTVGPGGGARGPAAALLVAGRRLAARHGRSPLPALRVLTRGGVHAADVGRCAARRTRLLDSVSYGARRVLRSPAPAAGVVAGSRAHRPRP
jgi:hypothetical protein